MTAAGSSYKGFRFPPEVISHCVWLYHRFPLSFRDVQELMLERGVDVSYETIRVVQRMDTGERHDATRGEDDAFWCWAVVETLRHTGIRAEELVDEDGAIIRTCRSAASQPQTGATGGQTMRRRRRRSQRYRYADPKTAITPADNTFHRRSA